jgi:hypothetical protein
MFGVSIKVVMSLSWMVMGSPRVHSKFLSLVRIACGISHTSCTAIYRTEKTQLDVFLDITKDILQSMARHAEEIENHLCAYLPGDMIE